MKPTESVFETTADVEISRTEQYKQKIKTTFITTLTVAWSDLRTRIGLGIILFFVLMGTVGTVLVEKPSPNQGPSLVGPFETWQFPLGTDGTGHDLLGLIVHATPAMLEMILAGAVFTTVLAALVGAVSGYKGGMIDRVLMIIADVMITLPGLPLVIVVAMILEPRSPWAVGIVLTINAWAGLSRNIRSQVLTIREESYVESSRILGLNLRTIVFKDILPGLMPYITVNFVYSARGVVFSSVALYFLGILPFTNLNWGVVMNDAYTSGGALYTMSAAHWLFFPMLTIIILSFGLILFAQGTDRIFNPRIRARHMRKK